MIPTTPAPILFGCVDLMLDLVVRLICSKNDNNITVKYVRVLADEVRLCKNIDFDSVNDVFVISIHGYPILKYKLIIKT